MEGRCSRKEHRKEGAQWEGDGWGECGRGEPKRQEDPVCEETAQDGDVSEYVQRDHTCCRAVQRRWCVCVRERERQSERNQFTTLPGERLDLRQVDVSVVQQLKQRRRTRSLSLVAASSV